MSPATRSRPHPNPFTWVAPTSTDGEICAPGPDLASARSATLAALHDFFAARRHLLEGSSEGQIRQRIQTEYNRIFQSGCSVSVTGSCEGSAFRLWCVHSRLAPLVALGRWRLGFPRETELNTADPLLDVAVALHATMLPGQPIKGIDDLSALDPVVAPILRRLLSEIDDDGPEDATLAAADAALLSAPEGEFKTALRWVVTEIRDCGITAEAYRFGLQILRSGGATRGSAEGAA